MLIYRVLKKVTLQVRKLNKRIHIPSCVLQELQKKFCAAFFPQTLVSMQTVWIQISQLLQKLADLDLHVCHTACAMLHDFVDVRVTCIHLLKISNDGNFFLLFAIHY